MCHNNNSHATRTILIPIINSFKLHALCGTRKFITQFTTARQLSPHWTESVQFMPSNSTLWRSILILSFLLYLRIPSGHCPLGLHTKRHVHLSYHSCVCAIGSDHLILHSIIRIFGGYGPYSVALCIFFNLLGCNCYRLGSILWYHVSTNECFHQGNSSWVTRRNITLVTFLSNLRREAFCPSVKRSFLFIKPKYLCISNFTWGTGWRLFEECAIKRNVVGLITNGVTGIFHRHNYSGRTMVLGSHQPLTEISTRNISLG
jgi:hypothetical protein